MRIVIHDGYDTIGGNKISVCSKDGCFLLDFGLNFSSWGNFFEEFVNPRTGKVIEDLLKLNLIPRIPIYREDLAPSSLSFDGRYRFAFFSHAHADHIGLSGILSGDLPFILSKETLAISLVDSNMQGAKIWSKIMDKKRTRECESLVRDDVRCSPRKGEILKRKVSVDLDDDAFEAVKVEDVWEELKLFEVYHSIVGATAIAVKVENWWVVYTGDFKLRSLEDERDWKILFGERRMEISKRTWNFIESAKELHPMILIVEGTTVTRGKPIRTSEMDVFENSLKLVERSKGLVLVDFPRRHVERLLTFLKVARETDRKLVLMPKDYAYVLKLEEIEPIWKLTNEERESLLVYHPASALFRGEERKALEKALDEGIIVDHRDIERDPGKFILSSGYWYITTLLDFNEKILKDSIYIHSTSEAYTEEQKIDAIRFGNWISHFGIEPHGLKIENDRIVFTGEFHSSGHAMPEDIEFVVGELDPEMIVPVHTKKKGWFVKKWKEKVKTDRVIEI